MKILQFTNYPTINPMHGGQIRARQIALALENAGHVVESVAVFLKKDFSEYGSGDIFIEPESLHIPLELAFLSDYLSGCFLNNDSSMIDRIGAIIDRSNPDLLMIEQPWLFAAVEKAAKGQGTLVYSSQNIEWRLKRDYVVTNGLDPAYIEKIEELERHAVSRSSLVIACTAADAEDLQAFGKADEPKPKVVVCGNGVSPFVCDDYDVEQWAIFFSESIGSPFPVFVSSGHRPNATGFWEMLAPGLTFLRPDEQIVVIGGVCNLLTQVEGSELFKELNLSRLHLVGQRPTRELQAMVRASHVVLLPIASGEGSNLKTAEALESGCEIVATTKAFRGYEAAMNLPHVHIADSAGDFRKAVREVLSKPKKNDQTPLEMRKRYYWSTQLAPLIQALPDAITKDRKDELSRNLPPHSSPADSRHLLS